VLHVTSRGFAAWGFSFRFESNDALLVEVVERCYRDLPPAVAGAHVMRAVRQGDEEGFRVTIESPESDVEECGAGRPRSSVLELLCWEVNRRARQSAAQDVVLHAAVFGGPLGAVALCGSSQSGKSTLAAAAAMRGWRHLSDDLGLISLDDMTIAPYARPIMVRPGGREHLGAIASPPAQHLEFFPNDWFVPASELGAVIDHRPVPLVAVGFLTWADSAALDAMSRAHTLHDLTLHSATVAAQGAKGFANLTRVATEVPGYRVGLGAASEVLDLLAPLVGSVDRYSERRHV
jgi:hypothetical protein